MKIFVALVFAYLSGVSGFVQNQDCLVKTKNGLVKGFTSILPRSGREYESYNCIPYAEPPTGKYRFWPPIPKNDWEGVYDASRSSCPICHQKDQNGTEDCLYLSVFVPRSCSKKLLKTIFYIEGIGFREAQGPTQPSYLLDECVIVVSLNYRVGAFGFLSLQTPGCAGNVGLKDQQLALKWVKENIHNFGGDANDVTLMGFSAGAASVTYHYINQESCSLFNRGIAESGNALMPWAFVEKNVMLQRSRKLGQLTNCLGTDEEICECLKSVPAETIKILTPTVQVTAELTTITMYSFVPTAECEQAPQPFLQRNAFELLTEGLHCRAPLITGVAQHEACIYKSRFQEHKSYLPLLAPMVKVFAPQCMAKSSDSACSKKVNNAMLDYYVKNQSLNENNIVEIITDTQFHLDTLYLGKVLTRNQVDVYLYSYTYNGGCSPSKGTDSESTEICHGDHIPYEFVNENTTECFGDQSRDTQDVIVSKRLVAMWANFAENGSPTPEDQSRELYANDFNWPVWKENAQLYCNIGSELSIRPCLGHDPAKFWNELNNLCCVEEKGLDPYPDCTQ